MARLNARNNAETVIVQAVSESDTEFVVEDAGVLPEPPFRLSIEDEIVEVSAVDGNALTVERAVEDSQSESYDVGTTVENKMTAGMYNELETEEGSQAKASNALESAKIYTDEQIENNSGSGAVESVNGKTGEVIIDVQDINGLDSGYIAIGSDSSAESASVSIGQRAESKDTSIALGLQAKAAATDAIAFGYNSEASYRGAVALGHTSSSSNLNEGILGTSSHYASEWKVPGSFSVSGSKNFEIPHPHPNKKSTHRLRHSAVESPTEGDNLYRYTIEASEDNQTVEVKLPDYFMYLNKDVDVWVNGHNHFGRAFGNVEENTLKVTCEKAGEYKALVIGTRQDEHQSIRDWHIRGVERKIGESWKGETYTFEVDEIIEVDEIKEVSA